MPLLFSSDQQPSFFIIFLSFLGLVSVLRGLLRLLRWVHKYFLRPSKNLKEHYGSWAVVTGSTDGIGKAFALQLARQGLNLVLVGRDSDKLDSVAKQITADQIVVIKTVVLDFTCEDMSSGLQRIEEAVEGLDVGVLVNNAGTTHERSAYFDEVGEEVWGDLVKVNVEGTTRVSRVVMKGMLERGKGAVVNVGSGSACAVPSFPLASVYSATKKLV